MESEIPVEKNKPRKFYAASTYPSEDYGVDIRDDTAKPYNKIHISSADLRLQMIEISRHSSVRVNARRWTERLRFLELRSITGSQTLRTTTSKVSALN